MPFCGNAVQLLTLQVVKTQLQSSVSKRGSNAFTVAGNIFRTEGPKGDSFEHPDAARVSIVIGVKTMTHSGIIYPVNAYVLFLGLHEIRRGFVGKCFVFESLRLR